MSEPRRTSVILVVEDHPLNMILTTDLLTLAGFTVLQAADGATALEVVRASQPDLILLDIQLPGMNGFEVFEQIRKDPRLNSIKIVALTASVMREEEQKILGMRFDGYIPKPIDTKQFVNTVRTFLE
jgi:CheY-like chemotaxis protein